MFRIGANPDYLILKLFKANRLVWISWDYCAGPRRLLPLDFGEKQWRKSLSYLHTQGLIIKRTAGRGSSYRAFVCNQKTSIEYQISLKGLEACKELGL